MSDRRNASEARCVKRVRDSNEIISECGTAVLSAGSDGNTRSTARCLRAVSEVRGKLEAKSLKEGWSDGMNKVRIDRAQVWSGDTG